MSKKKSSDFSSSPFKSLKGLSLPVSAEVKVLPPLPLPLPPREYDFTAEMNGLGVKILPADGRRAPGETLPVPSPDPLPPQVPLATNDEELFLSAISGMETLFVDEIPDLELHQATPRRLKLVEQGRLRPSDRLDLHGFTRSEALRRASHFLENAVHHGYPLVLIITGWGKSGSGEAVLRDEITRFLRTDGALLVSEWALAPPQLGGDGALLVFLRSQAKKG